MSLPFDKIKVLHVASEMHPILKGRIGRRVGSLPKAQRELASTAECLADVSSIETLKESLKGCPTSYIYP